MHLSVETILKPFDCSSRVIPRATIRISAPSQMSRSKSVRPTQLITPESRNTRLLGFFHKIFDLMAVKRDYGSFSKAASKLLAPLVAPFGFSAESGASFSRPRDGWCDSFFLQQSAYGSGDFCVNVGIAVPKLNEFWQLESSIGGLVIAWRLSDKATEHGGDCWYHAKNKEQLSASLERVAHNLERALPWFEQFQSLKDVTEEFRSRSGISKKSTEYPPDAYETIAMNYAFLLAISGDASAAREWLVVAHARATMPRYWDSVNRVFLIEPKLGTKLFRQTEETRNRISIIEAAMKRLESVAN